MTIHLQILISVTTALIPKNSIFFSIDTSERSIFIIEMKLIRCKIVEIAAKCNLNKCYMNT